MPMPAPEPGAPCGVSESCTNGNNYRVNCDGTTGACMCRVNGQLTAPMPTLSCATFDPVAALAACGFPAGKL
jgi:hypothetical protein